MAKLKRTKLSTAASRQAVIPGLGLPVKVALTIFGAVIVTMVCFRGWRSWLILFSLWALLGFAARVRVQRDHNSFHVDGLWIQTKAFFVDAHIWRGVTLRSFPPPRGTYRGVPR